LSEIYLKKPSMTCGQRL